MSEGTIRFQRRQLPYTQISNAALRDKRMSLAVRGLLALMLSLPPDKDYKISYFAKAGCIGKDTVYKYIGVLEKYGYLTRMQTHGKGGKFGANAYFFNDNPNAPCMTSPCTEKPDTVGPDTVEPCTVSPNTENADTKEYLHERNIPPISPQGEERVDKKICSWKEPRFLRFWAFYRDTFCASDHSRAGERGKAAGAWDKLKPDDLTIGKMGAKLEAVMKTRQWQDGIGIAMASTFLNGIRLGRIDLDELPAASAPPSRRQYKGTEIIDGREVDVYE